MSVSYFIKQGPVLLQGNELVFTKIPPKAKFPVKVTVVAWQYGTSSGEKIQSAQPIDRSFYITRWKVGSRYVLIKHIKPWTITPSFRTRNEEESANYVGWNLVKAQTKNRLVQRNPRWSGFVIPIFYNIRFTIWLNGYLIIINIGLVIILTIRRWKTVNKIWKKIFSHRF